MTFTLQCDDVGIQRIIATSEFPRVLAISGGFLRQADPHHVARQHGENTANTILFQAANARAVYGIVEHDDARDIYLCERIE